MPTVLTSWKEISHHLGKGVRTVQRWEIDLGLPVHRSDTGFPRAIFALPEELDAWARSHPLAPAGAVVASLYREIASLRELLGALSERLDGLERERMGDHSLPSNGTAPRTALLLRNDLKQARLALVTTVKQSYVLRKESEAIRRRTQALLARYAEP